MVLVSEHYSAFSWCHIPAHEFKQVKEHTSLLQEAKLGACPNCQNLQECNSSVLHLVKHCYFRELQIP